jgi:hypothetical protein
MNDVDLIALSKKIKVLKILNSILFIANLLLIIFPIIHYLKFEFAFDLYLLTVTILNIMGFYFSLKTSQKLRFYKLKHAHFSEKNNKQDGN